MKMNLIQKQRAIMTIFKEFSDKEVDEYTEDNFSLDKMKRKQMKILTKCVRIDIGKDNATDKEIKRAIDNVFLLLVFESLRRHGLIKRNKKGFFEKTKLGNQVMLYMEKGK